jgi:Protein of unknown function (DUF1566)
MKNLYLLLLITVILTFTSFAQMGISTDGTSPDNSAMLDVKSTTMGFLPPRMTSPQRNAIISPAEGLIVYCTDCTPKGLYYFNGTNWATTSTPAHYTGELFGGGIVFWVDNTGQHGLITSLIDLSLTSWSNVTDVLIGPTAQSTWNGQGNSTAIMGQNGHTNSAAKWCDTYTNANYGTGIYNDWYLPAIDQLSLIYHARYILNKNMEGVSGANKLANDNYWSSTEGDSSTAWAFYLGNGYGYSGYGKSNYYEVRAVRAF